ncbi:MAG: HNH endonuclease [Nitrososphaerota archaeon]|jgi:5-methylcytosine-specific restriction protein A|nr:HNH endonuclease [Nitrososphaerota archaeon]
MEKDLTHEQFIEILLDPEITKDKDITLLRCIYSFKDHKAYASQVGKQLGYPGKRPHSPLNLEIGHYAKRIAKKHDINLSMRENKKYKCWDLFFEGWMEGRFFVWKLKPNLVSAIKETSIYVDVEPTEISDKEAKKLIEGAKRSITVNAYERNLRARKQCIKHYGTKCLVCNFDFFKEYGQIGKDYIQVHHLVPIHEIGEEYEVDPIKDLVPICPNCHVMVHKGKNTLTVNDLRQQYMDAQANK